MQLNEALRLQPLKNLRGIIYFSGREPQEELEWLKKKFKYRMLGISEKLKIKRKWKNLIFLPKIEDDLALDSVLQASLFISLLIVLKAKKFKRF